MAKRLVSLILSFVLLFSVVSCTGKDEYEVYSFFAMDTIIEIKIPSGDKEENAKIFKHCEEIVRNIESVISKTVEESAVSSLNSDIDIMVDADSELISLVSLAVEVAKNTNGAFDITSGTVVSLWDSCEEEGRYPEDYEIAELLPYIGAENVSVDGSNIKKAFRETKIDLGAIGKGYAEEKVIEYLKTQALGHGILSFGGNIAVFGRKPNGEPFKVGLRSPYEASEVVGYFNYSSGYVSVSGDSERYYEIDGEKLNHIIDPKTGYPVTGDIHSVAVLSSSGALADALSTALFVMGFQNAIDFYSSFKYGFEAVFVTDSGIYATQGLDGVYTAADGYTFEFCG